MFTDTHCHIFLTEYEDTSKILTELFQNNVSRIILNGYNVETNLEVLSSIKQYNNVYGALGLHPNDIKEDCREVIEGIRENINNNKVIAVGEIGLDYHWDTVPREKQKEIFLEMLTIASENKKPAIIHNRNATEDIIKCLKKISSKGIIHCFSGSLETAREYIKLGYKLGINGIVTFKNSTLPEVLKQIPIKNILLETDAPYITPEPHRKEKNEPKYIINTAQKVAEIYNLTLEELSKQLEQNFQDVFDI